jgi:hypothetical protein
MTVVEEVSVTRRPCMETSKRRRVPRWELGRRQLTAAAISVLLMAAWVDVVTCAVDEHGHCNHYHLKDHEVS